MFNMDTIRVSQMVGLCSIAVGRSDARSYSPQREGGQPTLYRE